MCPGLWSCYALCGCQTCNMEIRFERMWMRTMTRTNGSIVFPYDTEPIKFITLCPMWTSNGCIMFTALKKELMGYPDWTLIGLTLSCIYRQLIILFEIIVSNVVFRLYIVWPSPTIHYMNIEKLIQFRDISLYRQPIFFNIVNFSNRTTYITEALSSWSHLVSNPWFDQNRV